MNNDEFFMKKALMLAHKGAGKTSPNPLVGAVVVKGGKVIGRAYHKKAGFPHAEIIALRQAKDKTKGTTLYINLEPCNHFGKTPPCSDAIIKSGVRRVVIGTRDPNPINNGKGIHHLRKSGIEVKENVLAKDAQTLNRAFAKFIKRGLPFVTIKVAQSLDGKIATRFGDSKWISCKKSRLFVHEQRKYANAVLIGINTVLKDNPLLTSRIPSVSKTQPKKVVIDPCLRIPGKSIILREPQSTIIATTKKAAKKKIDSLKKKGVDVVILKANKDYIDLKSLLQYLAKKDIMHILVEGGGETISGFLREKLADELFFFISPKIIGGRNAVTSVEGEGAKYVSQALRVGKINIKRFGEDVLIKCLPV